MQVFLYLTLAGALIILAGTIISMIPYRDRNGERYSMRNHFISELGEVGVSKEAWGFNTGMTIGGWLFLPLMLVMGIQLSSVLGWIGAGLGMVSGVAAAMVGVYSMERLTPHRKAAMTFFHSGLYSILFFTAAIFAQPAGERAIPLGLNIAGLAAIASFSAFLIKVYSKTDKNENPNYILDPNALPQRPRVWWTAILEWGIFFSIQAWFITAAILILT
jgi:hypothetical membrane protein